MTKQEFLMKLAEVKTMPELDALRIDCVQVMQSEGEEGFRSVQKEFIKRKNKLLRIPLRERTW